MPLRVEVALAPELMGRARPAAVYLVVDVIRATTTLGVCFEHGCRRVLVAPDIPRARAARERLARAHPDAPPPLLAGEAGGLAPAGFDCGNSPAELAARELTGRELVFATTNGTRALWACAGGGAIFAASVRNARAVAGAALAATGGSGTPPEVPREIVIVCAGRERLPAYDDTLAAGVLAREVARQVEAAGESVSYSEGARIALALAERVWALGGGTWDALAGELARSEAAAAIQRVGLGGDLAWCAAVDAAGVAPRVVGAPAVGAPAVGAAAGGLLALAAGDG